MGTQLKTFWLRHDNSSTFYQETLDDIAKMLDDGWELVDWRPIAQETRAIRGGSLSQRLVGYDAFLLKGTVPDSDNEQCVPTGAEPAGDVSQDTEHSEDVPD